MFLLFQQLHTLGDWLTDWLADCVMFDVPCLHGIPAQGRRPNFINILTCKRYSNPTILLLAARGRFACTTANLFFCFNVVVFSLRPWREARKAASYIDGYTYNPRHGAPGERESTLCKLATVYHGDVGPTTCSRHLPYHHITNTSLTFAKKGHIVMITDNEKNLLYM